MINRILFTLINYIIIWGYVELENLVMNSFYSNKSILIYDQPWPNVTHIYDFKCVILKIGRLMPFNISTLHDIMVRFEIFQWVAHANNLDFIFIQNLIIRIAPIQQPYIQYKIIHTYFDCQCSEFIQLNNYINILKLRRHRIRTYTLFCFIMYNCLQIRKTKQ